MLRGRDKRLPVMKGVELEVHDLRDTLKHEILMACDGSGKGRVAISIWNQGKILCNRAISIQSKIMTSNIAEYFAVCLGLETLLEGDRYVKIPYKSVSIIADSKLVVHQVSPLLGIEVNPPFKIRQRRLKVMADRVVSLWRQLENSGIQITIKWASRETTAMWYTDSLIRT